MTRREMLKRLGLTGAALAAGGGALAEQVVPGAKRNGLPDGCIGDPGQPWFGKYVFPLPHTGAEGSELIDIVALIE